MKLGNNPYWYNGCSGKIFIKYVEYPGGKMKSADDAGALYETSKLGTPKDYTEDMYRFYFEVGEYENAAKKIIHNFLGPERSQSMISLPYGYEIELPIQCVPDLIKQLVKENIAIYQVIRFAKTVNKWT